MNSIQHLSLVESPPIAAGSARHKAEEETYELQLSFGELTLIYKSLQAVKALGSLPWQDELLNDTILLVDQALSRAGEAWVKTASASLPRRRKSWRPSRFAVSALRIGSPISACA